MNKIINKIVGFIFLFCLCVFGQQAESKKILIDASDLPPSVVQQLEEKQKIENYGKYVGLGKEIGEAVKGSLSALTNEADHFAQTGVGKFTMALVAYKVIGTDLIQFVIGVPLFLIGLVIFLWSYWHTCLVRKILISNDEKGKKYETVNDDGHINERRWSHVLVFAVFTVLCIAVVFV